VKLCPVCASRYPDEVKFCPNDGQTLRSAAPSADLVGQVIADRYHIVKKLGEGGMGQVYLGEHVKMGRRSAIKVMNPSMVHDPDAVARFNREAANASRITHPNVCAIYDFGETPDGVIYLAMEFIEGEPLTDLIKRDDVLSVARAGRIFVQTADALQAAHDLGIVHRDLKPDNIMVSRGRDGSDVVKVVDFGIAKAVGGDEAGQKVTKTGLVVGTPEFMSPEQLAGDKVDGRSDLYALALVLFRMLTGRLPFEGDSVQETMVKRLTDDPTPLATVRPDLSFPPGLQAVLDSALARSPVDRYQTVAKFAEDVQAVTGLGAAALRTPVPVTRASAEGATQLLPGAGAKRVSARRDPVPAPRARRLLVPIAIGAVVLLGAGGAGMVLLDGTKQDVGLQHPDTAASRSGVPAGPDSSRLAAGRRAESTRVQPRPESTAARPGPAATARIDPVRAATALNVLFDRLDAKTLDARLIRDSALTLYDAASVSTVDKAFAAYVVANAYAALDDRANACRWARQATARDTKEFYTVLERDLCAP
jgi:serine/threonine-protein kinase